MLFKKAQRPAAFWLQSSEKCSTYQKMCKERSSVILSKSAKHNEQKTWTGVSHKRNKNSESEVKTHDRESLAGQYKI